MNLILLPVSLAMFDGEGAGMGETNGGSVNTQQNDSGANNSTSVAGEKASNTTESRRKAYMSMINGEYKDIHTDEMQKIINRRFKETKGYEEQIAQYREITDLLDAKYGTKDHQARVKAFREDSMWDIAADERGQVKSEYMGSLDKTVELNRLKEKEAAREAEDAARLAEQIAEQTAREQAEKWDKDAADVKAKYPDFDIHQEVDNPAFMANIKKGLSMEDAYFLTHRDEITRRMVTDARTASEKAVADNIRAKGNRPAETGTASTAGFTGAVNFKTMTAEQRAKIVEATKNGKAGDWRSML